MWMSASGNKRKLPTLLTENYGQRLPDLQTPANGSKTMIFTTICAASKKLNGAKRANGFSITVCLKMPKKILTLSSIINLNKTKRRAITNSAPSKLMP